VLVVAVMLLGLWLAGSPARARRQALDQRREQALLQISQLVESHYRTFRSLPGTLDDLMRIGPRPGLVLTDPVTRERYDYRAVDSLRYELCASFDAPDSVAPYGGVADPFWRHVAGHACFTFTAAPLPRP